MSAASPSSMNSPSSSTSLRDMPLQKWPMAPPISPPAAAPMRMPGGKSRPSTAPTATPPQAPCWVGFSCFLTWTLPFSPLVTMAASYVPITFSLWSSLIAS